MLPHIQDDDQCDDQCDEQETTPIIHICYTAIHTILKNKIILFVRAYWLNKKEWNNISLKEVIDLNAFMDASMSLLLMSVVILNIYSQLVRLI